MVVRLDKYLADAGKGTRSQVKQYVKKGIISVNGVVVKKSDIKIDTEKDEVLFQGQSVVYSEFQYYMLNKPQGVVSATSDKKDKTVIELIEEEKRRDLFPVGRLDKDTEGLLVITNDGKLANNLLAPGKHVDKSYYVEIVKGEIDTNNEEKAGNIPAEDIETIRKAFAEGVDIGDEKLTRPAILETSGDGFLITISEGRYHQIKRMFQAVGYRVSFLKRISMGKLMLDENLKPGEYRKLTEREIDILKKVSD